MATPNTSSRTIGIIAGSGVYPETFISAARRKSPGIRLVMCAFPGETRPELEKVVDATEWVRVGQLSKPIKFFRREGATEAVMMGQISPKNLFELQDGPAGADDVRAGEGAECGDDFRSDRR